MDGLLGILVGEQIVPVAKAMMAGELSGASWMQRIKPHVFGHLPEGRDPPKTGQS